MSESRDNGVGSDDIEAKKRKYSDPKQQEEENKAKEKEILNKGNESSSSDKPSGKDNSEREEKQEEEKTETATDTVLSDFEQVIEKLFGRENFAPFLPLKKRTVYRTSEGHDQNLVFSLSESGDSSENSNPLDEFEPIGIFLFEIQLKTSNRLIIPAETAAGHFLPASGYISLEIVAKLLITDHRNRESEMSLIYYTEEKSFMIIKGWTEFANSHNWEANNVIGFYRPLPRLSGNHFLVKFERSGENLSDIPDFRRDNFLFELELGTGDVRYSRLFMPSKEVEIHFPAIKQIPGTRRVKEIVRFTDALNKDWYMDVILYDANTYMIIEEWNEFVKEHNLEAMDVIKFYKPVQALHEKHFLIEIVRKQAGSSGPGGGEPSHGGRYKGKEVAA